MTKYTILCLAQNQGQSPEIIFHDEFTAPLNESAFKQSLKDAVADNSPVEGRVTSSRMVVVVGYDREAASRFEEDLAPVRPTNGVFSQAVHIGQEFPSAKAASAHLGLKNNEVALYLGKVKHLGDPGERTAKIRGVVVQYKDDYEAALMAQVRD
jgi:hypothetical protein